MSCFLQGQIELAIRAIRSWRRPEGRWYRQITRRETLQNVCCRLRRTEPALVISIRDRIHRPQMARLIPVPDDATLPLPPESGNRCRVEPQVRTDHGCSPIQRAARMRRTCPWANIAIGPSASRTPAITRSARSPTSSTDSPPTIGLTHTDQLGISSRIPRVRRDSGVLRHQCRRRSPFRPDSL